MKWLLLIFSVVKPFFSSSSEHQMANPIAEFKEMIKENAMKAVGVFAAASALATLFAAGIVIIAVDVGAQYDQNAYIYFSSIIMMGITLSLLSLIIALGAAKSFSNENTKPKVRQVLESASTSHPLQEALALLVHDFIKERELKRAQEEREYFESTRTQRSATNEKFKTYPDETTHH
jgi:hypothetical protein